MLRARRNYRGSRGLLYKIVRSACPISSRCVTFLRSSVVLQSFRCAHDRFFVALELNSVSSVHATRPSLNIPRVIASGAVGNQISHAMQNADSSSNFDAQTPILENMVIGVPPVFEGLTRQLDKIVQQPLLGPKSDFPRGKYGTFMSNLC